MDPQNNAPVVKGGDRTIFGILSYLGPLVIISLLVKKDDPFVKFHAKQGLVLFCIEVIISVLFSGMFLWAMLPLFNLIHLCLLVLAIIGIINVVGGNEKELPVVGSLAHYFTF
ncbi:MAG: DUF4870 domain-containing protein [Patescibacteria group bacterium]